MATPKVYIAARTYRGVSLPDGMTPACLDAVAALINMHGHEDNEESAEEAAIRVFSIVQRPHADMKVGKKAITRKKASKSKSES